MRPAAPTYLAETPPRGGLAPLALGLRLLGLAIVAASALTLPVARAPRLEMALGVLAGGLLGLAEYAWRHRRARLFAGLSVAAQVGVWSFLVHGSGGPDSPLFVAYLLEVPLSGLVLGRRGAVIAAVGGALGYAAQAPLLARPVAWSGVAVVAWFLALVAVLTVSLIGVFRRQQRELATSRSALAARASSLSEELRLLGDYLNGTLVVLDDLGRVISLNGAGVELLGLPRAAALGQPWQAVLGPDAGAARVIMDTLTEGAPRRGVPMRLEGAAGRPLDVVAELWISATPEGRRTHLLLDRPPESAGAGDPLQRLGEAASCVAHQIKNSLHALQGYVRELPLGGDAGGSAAAAGQPYLVALQSLGDLAEDILAMTGASRPAPQAVPLQAVLATAVLLARRSSAGVRVEVTGPRASVTAQRGPLVHALFNLIDNACRVTDPGSTVRVRVSREAARVCVEIEDEGPGLPPGVAAGGGPVASSTGAGLGLLASRRFLESSGGRLSFHCRPRRGTVCRVLLPIGSGSGEQAAEA